MLSSTVALLILVVAPISNADDAIFERFLKAKPLFPTVKPPDVIKPEEESSPSRIEQVEHTSNFNPSTGSSDCSLTKTDLVAGDYGIITTPNYPENYPGGTLCQWSLTSEPDTRIEATVFDLFTQPWFFTYFDYIQFSSDGNFTQAERMTGDLNQRTPFTIVSKENKIGIRFRSSTLFNFRGLKLHYLVKPVDPVKAGEIRVSPYDGVCGQSSQLFQDDQTTHKPSIPGVVPQIPILGHTTASPIRNFLGKEQSTKGPLYWPPSLTAHISVLGSVAEGQSNSDNSDSDTNNYIIGPGQAPEGAFPWMAALLIDGRSFCGASLIDNYHLLTAAHCTEGATKIVAVVGTNSLKNPDPDRKLFNITREGIFQHPKYNPNTLAYDISILRLSERVEFTEKIRPICLPNRFYNAETFQSQIVRVSGWGKPADRAVSVSPVLKNVTIGIMSNRQCRAVFRSIITGNQICTATKTTVSPCRGDSGGPLIIRQESENGLPFYMQIGIVSFGGNSCERALPVGFTRLTAFMDYVSVVTGRPF